MVKKRTLRENNYRAVWVNGRTLRFKIDQLKPITELKYPEFYDVKITSYCRGGCEYCYMNSRSTDSHVHDAVGKVGNFFGNMTTNQIPFQVAIGGGEPTEHPEFIEILKTFCDLGIQPNYTTNGMNLTKEILVATGQYCGGVALSCQRHLEKYWSSGVRKINDTGVQLNFHIVVSDRESIDFLLKVYSEYFDLVDNFVVLPAINKGRASGMKFDWDYLVSNLPDDSSKLAYGAKCYEYLLRGEVGGVSLYGPEDYSKYLDLSDMKVYKSSFSI